MGDYAFYSFKDETMLAWGMEPIPMPVRQEMEEAIFGTEQVRVDLLIDELYLFLNQYPGFREVYAGTMEYMTYLAGVNLGMEGDTAAAARYLEMGLQSRPESLLLRSNYALALQLQGQGDQALEQYEVILADPEGKENPMVRLLAARLYAEQEKYLEAYRLLDEMAKGLPADDAFWDFFAEIKELAGVEEEDQGEEKAGNAFCTACGNPLGEGLAFCNKCGKPVDAVRPGNAFCTGCGKPLKPGKVFCTACGKPV